MPNLLILRNKLENKFCEWARSSYASCREKTVSAKRR